MVRVSRPGMVERPRERYDARRADAPMRRLQPDRAAERGGDANTAARIGAHRHRRHPRRHRRAGTAARTTGDAVGVPRIARRAEVGVIRRHAEGKLVRVRLAERNRARLAEQPRDRRIRTRHAIPEDFRSGSGANTLRRIEVFERNRDAVQRAAIGPVGDLLVRYLCRRPRGLCRDRHVGVQERILLLNARQIRIGQFARRHLPPHNQRGGFSDAQVSQIILRHAIPPFLLNRQADWRGD